MVMSYMPNKDASQSGSGSAGSNNPPHPHQPTPSPPVFSSDVHHSTAATKTASHAVANTSSSSHQLHTSSTSSPAAHSTTTTATRVAKACLPCSIKKRRCDGGKPECKVCMVLGTPCSYEIRGLKRGPPKGFRSGPKESARAKLIRALETTVRDLSQQIGHTDAGKEIKRISGERGIDLLIHEHANNQASTATTTSSDLARNPKRIRKENSAPPATFDNSSANNIKQEQTPSDAEQEEGEDEDLMGINEHGAMRYIGSSSGIQLLQHQQHHAAKTASGAGSAQSAQSSPGDQQYNFRLSPRNVNPTLPLQQHLHHNHHHHHQPPIALPSVPTPSRMHGSSPSSHSGPSLSSFGDAADERRISQHMNAALFQHYWAGFHVFWPILYKPALDMIPVEYLPQTLDRSLINAIYAMGACVAHPALDHELESELGDGPAGEVFAQRAERFLFQARTAPTPSFASIQCCFLLSCYHQGAGQLSKAYLFSSLANSMAVDLGLHRHLHHYEHDLAERESRSRLVHCIHILSTSLSAEMGRPPMLRSKDIDVPPLGEAEQDETERDSAGREFHSLSLLNHSRRLFAIVETVLTQVHSFRRKAALRRSGSEGIRQVVEEIDGSLEAWRTSLPDWLKLPQDISDDKRRDLMPNFVAVQVWYYTAKLLLHRPFIPQDEGLSLTELLNDKYHQKCTQASQALFDMIAQLARASNVDRLSTDLAYIIFTAAVMFLFNARLTSTEGGAGAKSSEAVSKNAKTLTDTTAIVRQLSTDAKRQFMMCREWLRKLSDRWPAASAHKQLLDGFSNVGEGVLGGEAHTFVGRRPSIAANGALVSASSDWAQAGQVLANDGRSTPLMQQQQPQQQPQGDLGGSVNQALNATGSTQAGNAFGVYPTFNNGLTGPTTATSGSCSGTMSGIEGLSDGNTFGGIVMPQQSLNAYFEFAPNIFDMENVYWNETTTRLTPYLGPRDGAATMGMGQANGSDPSQQQQQQGLTFTPRTFGNISAMANYAAIGNPAVPPQLPVQQQQQQQQQQQAQQPMPMAPPSTIPTPRWNAVSSSSGDGGQAGRLRKTTDSPGLQMLAQQAVVSRTGTPSATASNNDGQAATSAIGNGSNETSEGAPVATTTTMSNLPAANFSISPFSFHQEPSAPEWGDVISMLQLPPAFIQ